MSCQALAGLLAVQIQSHNNLLPFSIEFFWLQPLLATIFSRLFFQPIWWLPIHLTFMPLAWLLLELSLPAWVYLAAFFLLVLIFWGTIKGDVPLFLSSSLVSDAVSDIIIQEQAESLIDLGAGIGSLVIPIANQHPHIKITAIEQAPIPWLILSWRCRNLTNITIKRDDFWNCHLATYDIVFAFLSPSVMSRLGEKCRNEMNKDGILVSSTFPLPNRIFSSAISLKNKTSLEIYCYRF